MTLSVIPRKVPTSETNEYPQVGDRGLSLYAKASKFFPQFTINVVLCKNCPQFGKQRDFKGWKPAVCQRLCVRIIAGPPAVGASLNHSHSIGGRVPHRTTVCDASLASCAHLVSSVSRPCYLRCMMNGSPARLKVLLQERHWQTYRTFQREYDKAARSVDPALVGTWPSRAQLARWLSGELKGLPYPDHCRVLEKMFPGWAIGQLFEECDADDRALSRSAESAQHADDGDASRLVQVIENRLDDPPADDIDWGPAERRSPLLRGSLVAAVSAPDAEGLSDDARQLAHRLLELRQLRRLGDRETRQLAGLAGCMVELTETLEIDIDSKGDAHLAYHFDLLNLSRKPLTRVVRELWFEVTGGPLVIIPAQDSERRVTIQRIHDTGNLSKFAFQISPPLRPGECARVGYTCDGGGFGERHYWRQAMPRYTRQYTLRVRQQKVQLVTCTASEEYPDGSETSANDSLTWDYEKGDVILTLTRDYLRPNQAVTLRWEVIREPA